MKLYRFSPIGSEDELIQAIKYLHRACHQLCFESVGRYLPVSGNVGIFCHDFDEFEHLTELRRTLTDESENYNGKYFRLKNPINLPEEDGIPAAAYDFLYIRKVDPYRSQVGDIDFVLEPAEHEAYKSRLKAGEFTDNARIFERTEENMIEIWNPKYDVASYIVTSKLADKVAGN